MHTIWVGLVFNVFLAYSIITSLKVSCKVFTTYSIPMLL